MKTNHADDESRGVRVAASRLHMLATATWPTDAPAARSAWRGPRSVGSQLAPLATVTRPKLIEPSRNEQQQKRASAAYQRYRIATLV